MIYAADLFCGAGGTSSGLIEAAEMLGKKTKLTAVNHWERAVETHTLNHPDARHFCESIDDINPRRLYKDGQLDVLWASPECTHHSIARGGRPINDQSRATAWCVTRWAEALRPNIILVENVPEFLNWGGIGVNGRPLKSKKGDTFRAWVATLESLGYRVAWKMLCAADYGDPTTRKRLFVQAVRGKRKICWPDPTHGPTGGDLLARKKWVPARDIIDWGLQGESIYERKKPLADKTLARIEAGLRKYGLKGFLVSYYGNGEALSVDDPLDTVTTKERFGLARPVIEHDGKRYLLDIRFRMLQPHELALAQGFPEGYQFAGNKTETVKQIGNAVPRRLARAICLAAMSQRNDISGFIAGEEALS